MIKHIVLLLLVWSSLAFLQLVKKEQLTRFFDYFPEKPALLVYDTNQLIRENEDMYKEVYQATKDYAMLLQEKKEDLFQGCPNVLRFNNVQKLSTQGYSPKSNYLSVRGKLFRLVPRYDQQDIQRNAPSLFARVQQLIPNYVKNLYSQEDIKKYLSSGSYLLPKVFIYTDAQEYNSIKKLAIYFYQRAKFAQVLTLKYNQTKLVVFTFDFKQKQWIQHVFPSKINMKQYQNMKTFIESYAPKNLIRQEYNYLGIQPLKVQISDQNNFTKIMYNNLERYSLIYNGKQPQKGKQVINQYVNKYGQYLNYIVNITQDEDQALFLAHNKTQLLPLDKAQLYQFPTYRFENIQQTAQQIMDFGNLIMLVEPSLSYLCSIENLKVLSGFFNCFPIDNQDIEFVKQKFGVPVQDKLAIFFHSDHNQKFLGKNINNFTFSSVIGITYNIIKQRIKTLAQKFVSEPIFSIAPNTQYTKICKTCFVYLHSNPPNYLNINNYKQSAIDYNEQFPFFHSDILCHSEYFDNKEPYDVLLFINNGSMFSVKQVSKQMVNKIVKKFRQNKLKMKQIKQGMKSNQKCRSEETDISDTKQQQQQGQL